MTERSWLYVPGHRPDRFAKACASGADAVIFDLEDAVPLNDKAAALDHIIAFLGAEQRGTAPWVRVNAGDAGQAEVRRLRDSVTLAGVVVPKATPADLEALASEHPDLTLVPLVESAAALRDIDAIASAPTVATAAMGEVDLAADLGVHPDAPETVWWTVRTRVVVALAAAGRRGPIGPVNVNFTDLDAYRHETHALRAAGFSGRQAIHPAQVAVIGEVFTPTEAELAQAARLLELADAAQGGVCVDDQGRMVDEAVLRSARRLLGGA